jgi:hypothetical protein
MKFSKNARKLDYSRLSASTFSKLILTRCLFAYRSVGKGETAGRNWTATLNAEMNCYLIFSTIVAKS